MEQPFARDQGHTPTTGPWLGGFRYVLPSSVAAGGTVTIPNLLRVVANHVEVSSTPSGVYPSRVRFTANTSASVTVGFESAQGAGDVLWLY